MSLHDVAVVGVYATEQGARFPTGPRWTWRPRRFRRPR